MTDCTALSFDFPACRKRRVAADVSGGEIASNGGVLLLRRADRLIGLTACVARRLTDARRRGKVEHGFAALPRQRVFALALGYEASTLIPSPSKGHAAPRHDLALQTAAPEELILDFDATPSSRARRRATRCMGVGRAASSTATRAASDNIGPFDRVPLIRG
ncbi:MAG: transposase [Proteobacteria bacterium]|nr:transposase [Pseudomonadota bacterium]